MSLNYDESLGTVYFEIKEPRYSLEKKKIIKTKSFIIDCPFGGFKDIGPVYADNITQDFNGQAIITSGDSSETKQFSVIKRYCCENFTKCENDRSKCNHSLTACQDQNEQLGQKNKQLGSENEGYKWAFLGLLVIILVFVIRWFRNKQEVF